MECLQTMWFSRKQGPSGAAESGPAATTKQRGDAAEDAALILQQAERCRAILKQLSSQPEEGDALFADIGLKALLEEVAEPHRGFDLDFDIALKIPPGQEAPRLRRLPEIVHGLSTLVENAADFATAHLRGSINVGLGGRFAEYAGEMMKPGTPIVLIAEPGSGDLDRALREEGLASTGG